MTNFDIDWRYLINSNDVDSIMVAIQSGVSIDFTPNAPIGPLSRSPLMVATVIGSIEMINLLLALGADREFKDICGNTPLHLAVLNNNLAAVKVLYDQNTAESSTNIDGQTPMSIAISNNYFEIVNFMTLSETCAQKISDDDSVTFVTYGERKMRKYRGNYSRDNKIESAGHGSRDGENKQRKELETKVDKAGTSKWSKCHSLALHICMKCRRVFMKGKAKHLHGLAHLKDGSKGGS
ncbi:unnamed protein product [Rodentolepis nana]|uniref:ANK_REP_REGION domain-containing protein n=1 Tax=Rodentolepis nana TaxID=102285 RepID=A0A0R3TZ73_RODNA|nr:unnamed protein product [Rodentolepis nana]